MVRARRFVSPLVSVVAVAAFVAPSAGSTEYGSPASEPAVERAAAEPSEAAAASDSRDAADLVLAWKLESMGEPGAETPPEAEITLAFSTDGQVSGNSGCNRYFGPWESSEPGRVSFGKIAATRMACPPKIMIQEGLFLGALDGVRQFEIKEGRLRLFPRDDSYALHFVRAAPDGDDATE